MDRHPEGDRRGFLGAGPVLLALLALLWGCSERGAVVEPEVPEAEPSLPELPVAESHIEAPPTLMTEPFDILVPPDNLVSFGAVGPFDVVEVPERSFVFIEVEGTLSFSLSSSYCGGETPPSLLDGETAGPLGLENAFWVTVGSGSGSLGLTEDSAGFARATFLGEVLPGTITVARAGGGSACSTTDGQADPQLLISGSQSILVEAVEPFELHAYSDFISPPGDTALFVATSDYALDNHRWFWQPGDTLPEPAGRPQWPNVFCRYGTEANRCYTPLTESGRMYLEARVEGGSAPVRHSQIVWVRDSVPDFCTSGGASGAPSATSGPSGVEGPVCPPEEGEGVSLSIASVTTTGQGLSFVSQLPEDTLVLTAQVTPSSLAGNVDWALSVVTSRNAGVNPPAGGKGAKLETTVPDQAPSRFNGYTHSAAISARDQGLPFPNALRFQAVATVSDPSTGDGAADTAVLEQDEVDVIRQEYLDFGNNLVPGRSDLGMPSAPHFAPGEINHGDFNIYLGKSRMLSGLEALRAKLGQYLGREVFLTLTSGYRNPVHHRVHLGSKRKESQHQYGLAVDLRISDQNMTRAQFFALVKRAAQAASACFEPEGTIRSDNASAGRGPILSHAHVDWRGNCPRGWN